MHLIQIRDADLGNVFDPDLGCDLGNASDPDLVCGSWECILSGSGMRILGMHLIQIRDRIFGMHLIRIRDADHLRILP
jgi:hypothetical protein